jgi:UDP-glucuronate 4-epimerase
MRDFTYVADIAGGVVKVFEAGVSRMAAGEGAAAEHRLYNIGHGKPVNLLEFIQTLERHMGKTAEKVYMPMQPGDVEVTWADTTALEKDVGYTADTDLDVGIKAFAEWFKGYVR